VSREKVLRPSSQALPDDFVAACRKNSIPLSPFVLIVNIAGQIVSLFENSVAVHDDGQKADPWMAVNRRCGWVRTCSCSTSRFGIGQVEGSNCTPLGLHRIAEKIGAGEKPGTVFKARKVIGHTSQQEFADAKITTRILWLEGLEPGLNRGGNVDSHQRYIYIHGTADQGSIGTPTSCGCIHLADADLVPLFDLLPSGTLVWISEK
jgi:L,D-transpeptidase catalytic domain